MSTTNGLVCSRLSKDRPNLIQVEFIDANNFVAVITSVGQMFNTKDITYINRRGYVRSLVVFSLISSDSFEKIQRSYLK